MAHIQFNTNNFIGGGFRVDEDMEVMLSSAQIPYNSNKFTLQFSTGAGAETNNTFNIVIPDGFFILLMILMHICNSSQFLMVYI